MTRKTVFVITKSQLVLKTTSNFANNEIPFNETMILDASTSYDPDQVSQALNMIWTYKEGAL